jgi:chromosome segregation ATPase
MASFLKKALNLFVEFDEETPGGSTASMMATGTDEMPRGILSSADTDKFEKHFDQLFEQANLPGPDYYEFYKMMETLEAHIHDENARLSAVFAALSIQGLTKQVLIDTANQYRRIIEKDKSDFDLALKDKLNNEVGQKQTEIYNLNKKIASNSEQIQKLTKEISDSQARITSLKAEVDDEEQRLNKNAGGYKIASQAVINKISSDVQKIQTTL